jgi:hypothetical protein
MVLDFLIRIERGYPGERATTTAANAHVFFQEEEEGDEEGEEEIVDLSLYMYIQSISRLRAKSQEKDVFLWNTQARPPNCQKGKIKTRRHAHNTKKQSGKQLKG